MDQFDHTSDTERVDYFAAEICAHSVGRSLLLDYGHRLSRARQTSRLATPLVYGVV